MKIILIDSDIQDETKVEKSKFEASFISRVEAFEPFLTDPFPARITSSYFSIQGFFWSDSSSFVDHKRFAATTVRELFALPAIFPTDPFSRPVEKLSICLRRALHENVWIGQERHSSVSRWTSSDKEKFCLWEKVLLVSCFSFPSSSKLNV